MSNEQDEISSIINQIKTRLPDIEESVSSVRNEIPPNLNHRIFDIRSSLSEIEEKVKYMSILSKRKNKNSSNQPTENNSNATAVSISEEHKIQIEKYKRYLKKHLNNTIQRHLSELDDKMKKIESDYIPYINSQFDSSKISVNPFMDLEQKMTKSFNDFSTKYQDFYSKITNIQVQKKLAFEKMSNHLTKSINKQISEQQNDLKIIKTNLEKTQKLINNIQINNEKTVKREKPVQNASTLSDNKKMMKEQKKQVDLLNNQWIDIRESFKRQLSSIDKNFDDLLKSSTDVEKSMSNYEKKLFSIHDERKKAAEKFESIQYQIDDEINKLDRSTLKEDISRLKIHSAFYLEDEKNQIEDLEIDVNRCYDQMIESYLT